MLTLDRAVKAALLYPRESAVIGQHEDEFVERMGGLLETWSTLTLTIVCDEIYLDDDWIYDGGQDERNFAFTLFDSGIRELVFHVDVTAEQLRTFVRLLRLAVREQRDDLATLMWERNLRNIGFVTVDVVAQWDEATDASLEGPSLLDRLRNRQLTLAQVAQLQVRRACFEEGEQEEHEPYLLRHDEIDHLIARVQSLRNEILLANASDVLWGLARQAETPTDTAEVLEWLGDLLPLLAEFGQLRALVAHVRNIRDLARRPGLEPAIRSRAEDILAVASNPVVAAFIRAHLERCGRTAGLREYLEALGPAALRAAPPLLDSEALRDSTERAVAQGCAGQEGRLRPFFHDPHEATALLAIEIGAAAVGVHGQTDLILATEHLSPRVRAAAFSALCLHGNLRGLDAALLGLDDRQAAVRQATIHALFQRLHRPIPELFPGLQGRVERTDFAQRPERDRIALIALMIRSDPLPACAHLEPVLLPRHWWLPSRRRRELAQLAVAALERAANEAARALLARAAERGVRWLRRLARASLERLSPAARREHVARPVPEVCVRRPDGAPGALSLPPRSTVPAP